MMMNKLTKDNKKINAMIHRCIHFWKGNESKNPFRCQILLNFLLLKKIAKKQPKNTFWTPNQFLAKKAGCSK